MKLTPAKPPLTVIGTGYSNQEILNMLEHQFPEPTPLIALVKRRFEEIVTGVTAPSLGAFSHERPSPVQVIQHDAFTVNCPVCGSELIADPEDEA